MDRIQLIAVAILVLNDALDLVQFLLEVASPSTSDSDTSCHRCEADFQAWETKNPTATPEIQDEAFRDIWENCPDCRAE